MQAALAQGERMTDIAAAVVATMHQLGILGLPRNYEVFYEALTGTNTELQLAVVSLSKHPTQEELDQISQRFFTQGHGHRIVEQARDVVARELEDIATLLRSEHSHIEKYGRILDETSSGLSNRNLVSGDLLQKIVTAISAATTSTIDHGKQVVSTLSEKTAELDSVKTKLEEYKRLADTDPLTQIWNRRAFDKEIARIYNSNKGILFNALILADIDRFKSINDQFGHPAGDKIIQGIAALLQGGVRNDIFVARTGGEEFALIVEGVSEDATYGIADRLRTVIEQTPFSSGPASTNCGAVTVSMGMCMASEAESPEDLYTKADQALYRSKMDGRNRVTRHSSMTGRSTKNWLLYKTE